MSKDYFVVASRGRNTKSNPVYIQNFEPRFDGVTNTLTTALKDNYICEVDEMGDIKVRKLTPTECFKLMGFDAEDCTKVSDAGMSNAQLYKQAGNSIVVNVLEAIFTELGETYEEFKSSRCLEEVAV